MRCVNIHSYWTYTQEVWPQAILRYAKSLKIYTPPPPPNIFEDLNIRPMP